MTGRVSADCVLNDMSRTLQDHTRKRSLYIEHVESAECLCVHMHVSASLYSMCIGKPECMSQVQTCGSLYSLMHMMFP